MTWEESQTQLVLSIKKKVEEFNAKSPTERYQWLIDHGLINVDGSLTDRSRGTK